MKKILLNLILISTAFAGKGQNLVPNGDFETFLSCPNGYSQIDSAIPWTVPTVLSSSDYYNQCAAAATNVGVPFNIGSVGYQPAHSGGAYSGIYIFYDGAEIREYMEVPLTSPLTANQCYHFEMYVNVYNGSAWTTSSMGAYLSDTLLWGINYYSALPYIPQFNNTLGNMFDTLNWTLVSGNYTAAGGESFLTIGNFMDNANSDTIEIYPGGLGACYVHIDDVSLTACTGTEEILNSNSQFSIYPNPVKDWLNVQISNTNLQSNKAEIKITDILGKEMWSKQFSKSKIQIPTSGLKNGIYFIEINNGKNIYRKKFIKE